ncbi:hypothetical protein KFK09_011514 [Dendrobium nobile]|uniref:Reverse transcriptase domain-containing protein n=1 Tax=Dendrobium nobile TaxID=94219 RepID=A0A8T3BET1_DENNO|nr:hypothetical protein KFK09_011514 [Dendrobium nobile]
MELQTKEAVSSSLSDDECWMLKNKTNELNSIMACLNDWWKQRAKVKWLVDGDRNTNFFHSYTSARRNSNTIFKIKDDNGNMVEEQIQIEGILTQFFNNKWRYRTSSTHGWPEPQTTLDNEDRNMIENEFSVAEIKKALEHTKGNISPGIDGISYSFIKAYWSIIKIDFLNAIMYFLQNGVMDKRWKDTLIVLIPKVSNPLTPANYRPFSLCNAVYKVAAKVIFNRLSMVISKLISMEQAAFIKGLDSFKIDMEQAYDSMSWETLRNDLIYFKFSPKFLSLILECVIDPRFSLIINGNFQNG